MKRTVEELVRDNIRSLVPYSTARDEYKGSLGVFLDANESPYENGYNRYPPVQRALKEQVSRLKGVVPERVFLGNGSDEAIDLCFRVFCEPGQDNAIAITPSYGMYRVAAAINDIAMREVPLGPNYSLPTKALLAAADERTKLLFLCSPNNPTGNCFDRETMLALADDFDGMVVVDEAYIDFADRESLITALDDHPNLIVLQTLSKAWGMAGLRLGMAFASERVISLFSQVKYPYNINVATMRLVSRLLAEPIDDRVAEIRSQRKRVIAELNGCPCVEKVWPSEANFVLVKVGDARGLYQALIDGGVIVRDRSKMVDCENSLRITMGTPEENDRMLSIVRDYRSC